MTFLFFDGPALTKTRGFRFEDGLTSELDVLFGCGDREGDLDGGGDGDGGLEKGVADALAAAFAALRAATALSIYFTTNSRTVDYRRLRCG